MGEELAGAELNRGTRLGGSTMEPPGEALRLRDLGITKQDSHRWQMMAEVPEDT